MNAEKGWKFVSEEMGSTFAAFQAEEYTQTVKDEIDRLQQNLIKDGIERKNMDVAQMKGFTAETWHEGTFNINAALNDSSNRARKLAETGHASVDVQLDSGEKYSLKYYRNAEESVKQQVTNVKQAYAKYLSNAKTNGTKDILTFSEYCEKYGYDEKNLEDLLQSVYRGQGRLIPSNQLEAAKAYLNRLIATESSKGNESRLVLYKNYKDTLDSITSVITDENGNTSYELTKEQAEKLAQMSKDGEIDLKQFGISADILLTKEYILKQSLKAGYTSAVIALVLQISPELIKAIDFAIKNDGISKEELKRIGIKGLKVETRAFIQGATVAAVTISCQSGKLGAELVNTEAPVIGALTLITLNTIENSIKVVAGKMSLPELCAELTRELIVSGASISCGYLMQLVIPEMPVFAYMLGSMIGGALASVILNITDKYLMAYCCESGFILFGLVTQDYSLPIQALTEMGIEVFEYDKIEINEMEVDTFQFDTFEYDTIEIYSVRRGMIGLRRVGYIPISV